MIVALLVIVALVSLATIVGSAVLSWAPGSGRTLLAAPPLGMAAVVLWLSWIGLAVPPGSAVALWLTAIATVAFLAVTWARRREPLLDLARDVRAWGAGVAAGFVAATPFLVVIARFGSTRFVHLSLNHDGFFFVAIPEWLKTHTTLGGSGALGDGTPLETPLLGSTWDVFWNGSWRVGSDSLAALIARATAVDPLDLWFPLTLSYLVVLVMAVGSLCRSVGLRLGPTVLAMIVVGTTAAALDEVADQHTPTVLGLALLLVAVAELVRGSGRTPTAASPVIVAVALGGLVAVYSELLTLVFIPLVAVVAVPWWRRRSVDLRWAGRTAVWSVLLAGPVWARSLVGVTGGNAPNGYASAYAAARGPLAILATVARGADAGPAPAQGSTSSLVAVAGFGAVALMGLAVVGVAGPTRRWWVALIVSTGWWWAVLGQVERSGYPQQRLVEWSVPLLVLGSVIGWQVASERVGRWGRLGGLTARRRSVAGGAVLVAACGVLAAPGIVRSSHIAASDGRWIDDQFLEAESWVAARDAAGSDTVVMGADYLHNLWIPYVLRAQPDVSYVGVTRDYYALDRFGPIDGRRWLLLDATSLEWAHVDDSAIVERNGRYALVDLSLAPARVPVAPGFDGRWAPDGGPVEITFVDGTATCVAGGVPTGCG